MRSLLALGLLITLCASASAATVQRSRTHQSVFLSRSVVLSVAARSGSPIQYNNTPSYDDPSRYGGGEALAVH